MKRFIFHVLDQYSLKFFGHQQWKAGVQHGVTCEQQRIIKLLEAECERPQDPKWSHYRESCYCGAIDLIKGEE